MLPHVIFNSSMTVDGRSAKEERPLFLNRQDEERVQTLRGSVDAILVGVETIQKHDPEFPIQKVEAGEPAWIIVDDNAEIPLDAKILSHPGVIVAVSGSARRGRLAGIAKKENIEVITVGGYVVNIPDLLNELASRGMEKILVEGSGNLPRRMFNQDCINEVYMSISPLLLGSGPELFNKKLDKEVKLKLEGILHYGDNIVLHYLVK